MKEQALQEVIPFLEFGYSFYDAKANAIQMVKERIERLEIKGSEKEIENEYKLIEQIENL